MFISSRVNSLSESVTLKLNSQAVNMASEGRKVFNLTAGQLPFKPFDQIADSIKNKLHNVESFQYSPAAGTLELRKKFMANVERTRDISFDDVDEEFGCVIGNGAKSIVFNVLASMIDPDDEVILLAPYWISYPEMLKLVGAKTKVISTSLQGKFIPSLSDLRKNITDKTKAIIVNSPNNPSGTHYSDEWMEEFALLLKDFPKLVVISDEIYYELYYSGKKPKYFYQYNMDLLKRTVIIDGISKVMACTGLRIGFCIANKKITDAVSKLQGQTASGANSLIQRALTEVDFTKTDAFLESIRQHLDENANLLKQKLDEFGLGQVWYKSISAFYYMIDFSRTPLFESYKVDKNDNADYAIKICEDILKEIAVAIVPGTDFGIPNSARISLVLPKADFSSALDLLFGHLNTKDKQ